MTDRLAPIPSAFPFEGSAYDIPRTRPPLRRITLDDWEIDQLADATLTKDDDEATQFAAALIAAFDAVPDRWLTGSEPGNEPTAEPEPPAYKHGDPIMRAVTAAALVIMVVFLSAATTHSRYSPHVILGCFAAAIATAAIGWAAYAITDRKAGR